MQNKLLCFLEDGLLERVFWMPGGSEVYCYRSSGCVFCLAWQALKSLNLQGNQTVVLNVIALLDEYHAPGIGNVRYRLEYEE